MSEAPGEPAWRDAAAPSLDDIATLAEAAFAELPEKFRKLAGEVVFRSGDESDTCYVVRDGHARAIRTHPDGRTITLANFGPGDIFGELAMFEDERRSLLFDLRLPIRKAPEPGGSVTSGEENGAAVRTNGQTHYVQPRQTQRIELLRARDVPDTDRLVFWPAGGDHAAAVRCEGHSGNLMVVGENV